MNADGSNIVEVNDTPDTFENWPSWGPALEAVKGRPAPAGQVDTIRGRALGMSDSELV